MSRGSVRRRGSTWRGRFRDQDGRDRQRSFRTQREASEWVRTQLNSLASGQYVDPSAGAITFREYAEAWRTAQHVRPRTRALHEGRIRNYLNPVLGDVPLKAIRRSHVVTIVTTMAGLQLSPLVIRYTRSTLSAILEAAVADRLLVLNVADDRSIPMPRRERTTGTLDSAQVAAIAARMTPRLRAMVVVGASSGLRPSELSGLTLDRCRGLASLLSDGRVSEIMSPSVAPGTVVLRIDRQLVERRSFGPVKTSSSNREVAIPAPVAAVLVEHVRAFGTGDRDLIFTSPTGKALTSASLSAAWARATEGLVVPAGSWHLLRHHHASELLSRGLNPAMVAKRLGHANASITMNTYAHCLPSDDEKALDISAAIARALA